MVNLKGKLRTWLRSQQAWIRFRELSGEGFLAAWQRRSLQRLILQTPAVRTSHSGPVEVRALTWRRDWLNVLWSLKSFYHFSGADYPLFLHDGGLGDAHITCLRDHFPDATIVSKAQADELVEPTLRARNLARCVECRHKSVMARKFFDFYMPSTADRVIAIDSDVLFFSKPTELLHADPMHRNRYNLDPESFYALKKEKLKELTGLDVPARINAGLSVVWRSSIDLPRVEEWLGYPGMLDSAWLVEQTLHALVGAVAGVTMLPESYLVSTRPGLPAGIVAKHYPGFYRPLLYQEGMRELKGRGLLQALQPSNLTGVANRSPA